MSRREELERERLGRLYEDCVFAVRCSPDAASFRPQLERLRAKYPGDDVDWMLGVVAEDARVAKLQARADEARDRALKRK